LLLIKRDDCMEVSRLTGARGTVHGTSILLERPLPELEGKRVRVRVELVEDEEFQVSAEEHQQAWAAWVTRSARASR
jgi:nitrogen fixation protein FixH